MHGSWGSAWNNSHFPHEWKQRRKRVRSGAGGCRAPWGHRAPAGSGPYLGLQVEVTKASVVPLHRQVGAPPRPHRILSAACSCQPPHCQTGSASRQRFTIKVRTQPRPLIRDKRARIGRLTKNTRLDKNKRERTSVRLLITILCSSNYSHRNFVPLF